MKFLEEQEKQIYEFILKYKSDFKFREEIDRKYFNEQDSLSILEIYALEEILRVGNKSYFIKFVNRLKEKYNKEEITVDIIVKNYGYDNKNKILTQTENEIKNTLTNILFGELIFDILDKVKFQEIKFRQKEPGVIANIDKEIIINELQRGFKYNFDKVSTIVEDMYYFLIKHGGIDSSYFKKYLKYNTNISSKEIMDIKKSDVEKQKIYVK